MRKRSAAATEVFDVRLGPRVGRTTVGGTLCFVEGKGISVPAISDSLPDHSATLIGAWNAVASSEGKKIRAGDTVISVNGFTTGPDMFVQLLGPIDEQHVVLSEYLEVRIMRQQ